MGSAGRVTTCRSTLECNLHHLAFLSHPPLPPTCLSISSNTSGLTFGPRPPGAESGRGPELRAQTPRTASGCTGIADRLPRSGCRSLGADTAPSQLHYRLRGHVSALRSQRMGTVLDNWPHEQVGFCRGVPVSPFWGRVALLAQAVLATPALVVCWGKRPASDTLGAGCRRKRHRSVDQRVRTPTPRSPGAHTLWVGAICPRWWQPNTEGPPCVCYVWSSAVVLGQWAFPVLRFRCMLMPAFFWQSLGDVAFLVRRHVQPRVPTGHHMCLYPLSDTDLNISCLEPDNI